MFRSKEAVSATWRYLEDKIDVDLAILTEAKPRTDTPYELLYREGMQGPSR